MSTTTATSRSAVILSWSIALVACLGVMLLLWLIPPPEKGALLLPDKDQRPYRNVERKPKRELSQQARELQSRRPLPPEYARQLVKQSEVLVKRNLGTRLRKFQEMSKKMRLQKDGLLNKVETRELPPSAPPDANNTSLARNIPRAGNPPLGADPSVKDLYDMLSQYETEIQKDHLAVSAAKRALSEGLSFPEVYNSLRLGLSQMPSFEDLIRNQTNGAAWKRSPGSTASAGLVISNTADLSNYRELLGQASRQTGLADTRLEGLFGGRRLVGGNKSSPGSGSGSGSGWGGAGANAPGSGNNPISYYQGARLDEDMVKAQALPGRRFSKDAERKGWLYVNTWYMIGPWESYGRDDFAIVHPPELSVDFDAVYTDGKTGMGVVETESHPIRVDGEEVVLDGKLRWKFMQSASMHNTVPVTTGNATYYAYTELYFDEAVDMLVAIGTDDAGRLWINGKDVWQDTGTSWYHIDEHITPFHFRQGWNTVLIRLENGGGGATGFSFMICPGDAVSSVVVDD